MSVVSWVILWNIWQHIFLTNGSLKFCKIFPIKNWYISNIWRISLRLEILFSPFHLSINISPNLKSDFFPLFTENTTVCKTKLIYIRLTCFPIWSDIQQFVLFFLPSQQQLSQQYLEQLFFWVVYRIFYTLYFPPGNSLKSSEEPKTKVKFN